MSRYSYFHHLVVVFILPESRKALPPWRRPPSRRCQVGSRQLAVPCLMCPPPPTVPYSACMGKLVGPHRVPGSESEESCNSVDVSDAGLLISPSAAIAHAGGHEPARAWTGYVGESGAALVPRCPARTTGPRHQKQPLVLTIAVSCLSTEDCVSGRNDCVLCLTRTTCRGKDPLTLLHSFLKEPRCSGQGCFCFFNALLASRYGWGK